MQRSSAPELLLTVDRARRLLAASFVVLALGATLPLLAQTDGGAATGVPNEAGGAAGADEDAAARETVFSLILKGRWIMIPIGLCSVIVLTVAIERALSLRASRVASPGVLERVFDALPERSAAREEQVEAAREATGDPDRIVDRLLRVGVAKLSRDETHAQSALEDAAAKELHLLTRKLRPFSIVAALCPLLGLLGTIYGMITCFEQAAAADTAARAETLASGIYVALVSTAAGLTVAIPAMVLNFWYQGRVDRIADLMEENATEFLDNYYGRDDLHTKRSHSRRSRAASAEPAEAGAEA